ncbi:MAG: helix-turn-helix transcriptional regulator [Allosphingosinicella sp.]|uniref:helix-turn-helix transcriptional regulator n=1 Tax=Allosphingosinicella sp. TaxID=2823234 RepID=UPI0039436122
MSSRMAKLDRLLALVHALAEDAEGLTLDEMATRIGVNRRTAERMRDIIMMHFDLEDVVDGRVKRWRIVGRLGRMFTQPSPEELAALQTEIDGQHNLGQHARAEILNSLLGKIRGALDAKAKARTAPDLEALAKAQRTLFTAGSAASVPGETLAAVQGAIIAGSMIEFDYRAEGKEEAAWRRVVPYGLIHGSISYLVGKIPSGSLPPVYYRLDRMENVRASNQPGVVPDDFDLDEWLSESFGIWRDAQHDVMLRFKPSAASRAREWRFHPKQHCEDEPDGFLTVSFRAGGLRELAEHLFCWGANVEIRSPDELRSQMVEMLETSLSAHRAN